MFSTGFFSAGWFSPPYYPPGDVGEEPVPEVVRNRGGLAWEEPSRRRRKAPWEARDEEKRALIRALEDAYARAVGEVPAKDLIAVVKPFVKGRVLKAQPPSIKRVDFSAMARSAQAMASLLKLDIPADETEAIMLLLDAYPAADYDGAHDEESALLMLM